MIGKKEDKELLKKYRKEFCLSANQRPYLFP